MPLLAVHYLLAAALLVGAPDVPDPAPPWGLAPALQSVALQMELLDGRERGYLLRYPENFAADLAVLQERYAGLLNAPRLAEAGRWPARELVGPLLADNRRLRSDLLARLELDSVHEDELRAVLAETDHCYRVWDAVRDARTAYLYVTVRREALQELRRLIGAPAYYRGQLPPHVPAWRFPVRDW